MALNIYLEILEASAIHGISCHCERWGVPLYCAWYQTSSNESIYEISGQFIYQISSE